MQARKLTTGLLQKMTAGALFGKNNIIAKSFSSVTYEMKDLILDPLQKGKPVYNVHLLDEA
jgi:pyruvate dehydrogenase E1 component alpha subunit